MRATKHILFAFCLFSFSQAGAQTVAPDKSGMDMTAAEWTKQVTMGWNLGNSLESSNGETGWGNPRTT